MNHTERAPQLAVPRDKRMHRRAAIDPLEAVVRAFDDVQQTTRRAAARIVFRGEDLAILTHHESKRIPEATGDAAQAFAIGGALAGLFGFTLSWDEIARSSQAMGDLNTLPLELQGLTTTVTTPAIYALGTVTTAVSLLVIVLAMAAAAWLGRTRRR